MGRGGKGRGRGREETEGSTWIFVQGPEFLVTPLAVETFINQVSVFTFGNVEVPKFSYDAVWDGLKEASVAKVSPIRPDVSAEL